MLPRFRMINHRTCDPSHPMMISQYLHLTLKMTVAETVERSVTEDNKRYGLIKAVCFADGELKYSVQIFNSKVMN